MDQIVVALCLTLTIKANVIFVKLDIIWVKTKNVLEIKVIKRNKMMKRLILLEAQN